MKTLLAFSFFILSSHTFAAPIPGTSSSQIIAPKLGLFRSPLGFEMDAGGSGWLLGEAPKENKYIATLYRSPTAGGSKVPQASLTVRVDKLKKAMPLQKYMQRWMKEYPKYGFDVVGSKSFIQNKAPGYVVDLVNHDSQKQVRQVVFAKNQKAVILTCRDSVSDFKNTLKNCNQIVKTFSWTE